MTNAPLRLYRGVVRPDWIDFNGHMNVAYYMLAFDDATTVFFDHLGLGEGYMERTNCSTFTLEGHITYDREVKQGDELVFATRLLDYDSKRLHYFHEMYQAGQGYLAFTSELITAVMNVGRAKITRNGTAIPVFAWAGGTCTNPSRIAVTTGNSGRYK